MYPAALFEQVPREVALVQALHDHDPDPGLRVVEPG
jgi:hypothetical protein